MNDEIDDIAWELGIHPTTLIRERELVENITTSMWCNIHTGWKTNPSNPVCLYCENDRLRIENDELRKSIKIIQKG